MNKTMVAFVVCFVDDRSIYATVFLFCFVCLKSCCHTASLLLRHSITHTHESQAMTFAHVPRKIVYFSF